MPRSCHFNLINESPLTAQRDGWPLDGCGDISPPSEFELQAVQAVACTRKYTFISSGLLLSTLIDVLRTLPSHNTNGADDREVCHENFKSKSTSNDTTYLNKIINKLSATQCYPLSYKSCHWSERMKGLAPALVHHANSSACHSATWWARNHGASAEATLVVVAVVGVHRTVTVRVTRLAGTL